MSLENRKPVDVYLDSQNRGENPGKGFETSLDQLKLLLGAASSRKPVKFFLDEDTVTAYPESSNYDELVGNGILSVTYSIDADKSKRVKSIINSFPGVEIPADAVPNKFRLGENPGYRESEYDPNAQTHPGDLGLS